MPGLEWWLSAVTRTSVSCGSHVDSQSGYFDLHEMTMNDVLYDLTTYGS